MQRRLVGPALALGLALAGCTASATTSSPGNTAPASAAATPSPSGPVAAQLQVGDCTGDIDLSGASITNVPTLPCTGPHHYEVHARVPVPGEVFPGAAALAEQARTGCSASFTSYVGVEQPYSRFGSAYLAGDEAAWVVPENRVITCLLGSAAGELVGSARGDTRVFPEKGQCTGPQDVAAQAVEVVDCDTAHHYEVFAVKQVTGRKPPTAAEEQKLVTSVCQAGFANFVGVDVGKSKYELAYFLAGADIWDKVADHRIVCSAGTPKGGIKGSLKGAKK